MTHPALTGRFFIKQSLIATCILFISGCAALMGYEPATFTVSGSNLIMNGVIDSDISNKLEDVLEDNPQVTTIVMQYVEGSVDDEANLEAARRVRDYGLNTFIPSDGLIASGGTDFFLAGVKRTVHKGAQIGVHAWGGDDIDDAAALPRNHPEHQRYLSYYREMGIPEDFYWYTMHAAPSDDMHWMTETEQTFYQIATD